MIQREKIQKTFQKRPQILEKIQSLCKSDNFSINIDSEIFESIKKVVLKIATGHLVYECNHFLSNDVEISIMFEPQLNDEYIKKFNSALQCNTLPEIGSRGSNQLCLMNNMFIAPWKVVDKENYRYQISNDGIIKMVIREFLYVEILF